MSQANDGQKWIDRWEKAKTTPWAFMKHFTYTWDEHDFTSAAMSKPFPDKAMYRVIVRAWVEYDLIFIEKSRQVMMTWLMSSLYLWLVMFHPAKRVFFQSKKQEDADAILKRAVHIYKELAKLDLPGLPVAKKIGSKVGTTDKLEFPEIMGDIWAIPQGEEVVRSYTCSGIFADEMNHQPKFDEGYAAAMPVVSDGAKYTAQGTANGKTAAYRYLYGIDDRTLRPIGPNLLDSDDITEKRFVPPEGLSEEEERRWIEHAICSLSDEDFNAIPFHELVAECPGMRYWQTADGGHSMKVHYTADPDKDPATEVGAKWFKVERAKQKSQAKWDREMEIKYDTFEGRPVIDNWDANVFVPKRPLEYDPSLPLYLAADFGSMVCGCVFAQYGPIPEFNAKQMRILSEVILYNSDTVRMAEAIVNLMMTKYRLAWDSAFFKTFCDPAGNQRRETTSDKSLNTSIKIFRQAGLKPDSKKFGIPESTQLVQTVFSIMYANGSPGVLIDPSCKYMIGVFSGGWHFPAVDDGKHTGKPEKDGTWDHGGDIARILLNNVISAKDLNPNHKTTTTKKTTRRGVYRNGRLVAVRGRGMRVA